ncbi:hypothetical protein [Ralstonia sp. 24A2]|uniref:hypothetical protein n=1 Tax=Ralstonia sp. 24A2 TaxID=3447364 RepID=UPI003F695FC0
MGAIVIALFGSGFLAIRALVRKEGWRWLGIVALLLNTLPSAGLLIAMVVQRQSA